MAYGCKMETIPIPIEAVDTHRPKPQVNISLFFALVKHGMFISKLLRSSDTRVLGAKVSPS
jgi:hypothetical protein